MPRTAPRCPRRSTSPPAPSVIETNGRLVAAGRSLWLDVRVGALSALDLTPRQVWAGCGRLRRRGGPLVVPTPTPGEVLALASRPLREQDIGGRDGHLGLSDADRPRRLSFETPADAPLLADLVGQGVLRLLEGRDDLWTLDSPRIFYESEPAATDDRAAIAAYLGYRVSAVPVDGEGVVVVVDPQTAYLSAHTVDWFFDASVPSHERDRRRQAFARLTDRSARRKGTLVYDRGRLGRGKCYFEKAPGVSCGDPSTRLSIRGTSYASLFDYYRETAPFLGVAEDDPAVLVSFPGMAGGPVPVAARLLRVRVSTDAVPRAFARSQRLRPHRRAAAVDAFWRRVGTRVLGPGLPGVEKRPWQPSPGRVLTLGPPDIEFGTRRERRILTAQAPDESPSAPGTLYVEPPDSRRITTDHRGHYDQRLRLLDRHGAYDYPTGAPTTVTLAAPTSVSKADAERLAYGVRTRLQRWSRQTQFEVHVERYDDLDRELARLQNAGARAVLLVLDDARPEAYHEAAYALRDVPLKRVLASTLRSHSQKWRDGQTGRWEGFVTLSTLDLFALLGGAPFGLAHPLVHGAVLAVDVGQSRRHVALSLLVARRAEAGGDGSPEVEFRLRTRTFDKPDVKHEAINPRFLADKVAEVVADAGVFARRPLRSLLVLRDGREVGDEADGLARARDRLLADGVLTPDARVLSVDLRKSTGPGFRLWSRCGRRVDPAPEGTAVHLGYGRTLLATTGAPRPPDATPRPLLIEGTGPDGLAWDEVARDVHALAHLNWASPTVPQRLPLPLKQADERLQDQAAQHIRRFQ